MDFLCRTVMEVPKVTEHIINVWKKFIQDGLHEELGILADAPTQGAGNTNDGNTARRFFNNADVVIRITEKG
ncbi:hypothetical protein TSAR_014214 [Trichomalopsis sarcophagae]|uniref:Uncharacterized protein n=1 Tax=Trichomalopsis sarcophagae TaxID=543379 RepID=A0A232FLX1_9HYME|nr:hypothetical protein TSAR_014214 [Trichomalopsis sarcophagae]